MAAPSPQFDLADIQGMLLSGYGHLPQAAYLLLQVSDPVRARNWLKDLSSRITPATGKHFGTALNIAFTYEGCQALGLDAATLSTFPYAFRQGMQNRSDVLGDYARNGPQEWAWGGPHSPEIHVLLIVFAEDPEHLTDATNRRLADLLQSGLTLVFRTDAMVYPDLKEHFGFIDGVSQPVIAGTRAEKKMQTGDPAAVNPGDFVLGQVDAYGEPAIGPLVDLALDPANLLPAVDVPLTTEIKHHLGANGTYLVFRQLQQFVTAFWQYMDNETRRPDGSGDPVARVLLGSKFVGRWPGGAPLVLSPDVDNPALSRANNFTFTQRDPNGYSCPIGAHIRRAFARDALPPNAEESSRSSNRHRLIRRGRHYGPRIADPLVDDGIERGINFIALNSDIERQFEMVSQTWINNCVFNDLQQEVDPLVGPRGRQLGTMTIQADPVRRRLSNLPDFIRMRGGAYFFMPGIAALHYLGSLGNA